MPREAVRFDFVRSLVRRRYLFRVTVVVSLVLACVIGANASRSGASSAWTLRIAQTGASPIGLDRVDRSRAGGGFFATQLLWSTCAFLYDYPDAPAPAAVRFGRSGDRVPTVRRSGRNYTTRSASAPASAIRTDGRDRRRLRLRDPPRPRSRPWPRSGRASFTISSARQSRGSTIAITMDRPAADLPAMLSSTLFCAIPAGLPRNPTKARRWPARTTSRATRRARSSSSATRTTAGIVRSNAAEIDWMFQVQGDTIALQVERGDADYGIVSPAATAPDRRQVRRSTSPSSSWRPATRRSASP